VSTPDPITRLNAALEGRYRIERQLGEGRMATVCAGERYPAAWTYRTREVAESDAATADPVPYSGTFRWKTRQ